MILWQRKGNNKLAKQLTPNLRSKSCSPDRHFNVLRTFDLEPYEDVPVLDDNGLALDDGSPVPRRSGPVSGCDGRDIVAAPCDCGTSVPELLLDFN